MPNTLVHHRFLSRSCAQGIVFLSLFLCFSSTWGQQPAAEKVPYEELRLLSDIYANIKRNYVDEVDNNKLFEGAIHGMLRELDPYSVYLTKKEYSTLKTGTTGRFGGLGIEVSRDEEFLLINSPIPGTPAEKAGLQSGDLIVKIDGKDIKGMSLSDGIDLMRGKVGTPITLTIQREEQKPFDVKIVRAIIKRNSVRSLMMDDGFAYIRLSNFQLKSGAEVANALVTMTHKHNDVPLNGIILDLRGNPGGVLNEAVAVTDVFLDKNMLVVYTNGREGRLTEYKTNQAQQYRDIPLIVLINQRSASASEIVAGALQDHNRATIMGVKSFGKASVQTIHPIDKLRALKLTTARYHTPNDNMIQNEGIRPQIEFTPEDFTKEEKLYKEKLGINEETTPEKYTKIMARKSFSERVRDDWQIKRAIAELKAITKTAQKKTAVVPQ